jgi:hypothetical protein
VVESCDQMNILDELTSVFDYRLYAFIGLIFFYNSIVL